MWTKDNCVMCEACDLDAAKGCYEVRDSYDDSFIGEPHLCEDCIEEYKEVYNYTVTLIETVNGE